MNNICNAVMSALGTALHRMKNAGYLIALLAIVACDSPGQQASGSATTTMLWYDHPVLKWENALPVGNGRLGAMVFGRTDVERIQFNEETYWSGGPYSQTVKGGSGHLSEIQKLVFEGKYKEAHKLFGRYLMGYPVEQQKYQSMGDVILKFDRKGEVKNYRLELDLDSAIVRVRYEQDGVRFTREIFSSAVDQVIVIRLTASAPENISLSAELRGCRNDAHSNYGTDYFRMDRWGDDGLQVTGRSADYLGIEGKIRYRACVRVRHDGGSLGGAGTELTLRNADAVTFYLAAATNFVNYRDVSADPEKRTANVFSSLATRSYEEIKRDHVHEYQNYFRRASLRFGSTPNSFLPTDRRLKVFDGQNDPNLAALCFQFGRYLLISSSRPGTQPANLQGIWNQYMNPSWDSKYTTNINTEMNYWPAEVSNLSDCTEPLARMIQELTIQGTEVAREHYGARGWVFHQNTDLWRVAAPMDGAQWGTFTTGGAWLCTHLWEHFLFTGDTIFLRRMYPVMKGCAEFFLDFLVEHPKYGWLVTNPSTSPENFPDRPDNGEFFDEVTSWNSPGVTICAGSTIDMQILSDLFTAVAGAAEVLNCDKAFSEKIVAVRSHLAPMQIGKRGDLQEWLEDWGQKEKSHRHISSLYGLFPGHQISVGRTPDLANAARVVLKQRGLDGNGWSSAWKMCCWTRLRDAERALENFTYGIRNYTFENLFSNCAGALQIDGSFGVTAGVAEMIIQSQDSIVDLLPSLPGAWREGEAKGLCARGGFVVDLSWREGRLLSAKLFSKLGKKCRVRTGHTVKIFHDGAAVPVVDMAEGVIEFDTQSGQQYIVR
jgi:alpha-L-fucosidase 2